MAARLALLLPSHFREQIDRRKMSELILSAEGDRMQPVDVDVANDLVALWQDLINEAPEDYVITTIVLSCRKYTVEGARVVADFLTPLAGDVTNAILDDMIASLVTEDGLQVLQTLSGIFANSQLRKVVLNDNAMGNRGIDACNDVLGRQQKLEELFMLNCGLSEHSTEVLAQMLMEGDSREHLRVLHFFNNMIGPEGAESVAQIFRACPNLNDIRYSHCRARPEGSIALLRGLDANEDLQLVKLDLEGCVLYHAEEEHGLEELCSVLRRSPELTHLIIKDCDLEGSVAALTAIKDALVSSGAKLVHLDVGENELDAEAGTVLAELIQANIATLKVLKAETNELTSLGVERIMSAFDAEDAALEELDLCTNLLGHRAVVALTEANLPNLRILNLNDNGFSIRDLERLESVFGDRLVEIEDNDADADYDDEIEDAEDEAIEQELQAQEEESVEEDADELDFLSQEFSQQRI